MSVRAPVEAAAAAILDGDGRLLLIKENYDRRRWGFPGGAVEGGETPVQAVVGEVREETGADVSVGELVGTYGLADSSLSGYVFRCTIVAGTPAVPPTDEIAEISWCATDELPSPQTNLLHHALSDLLAGRTGVERRGLPRIT